MEGRRTWQTVLMWAAALVIVNALWLNVAGQTAPNEVNTETQFQTHREIDISSVFGNNAPIPAELTTTFSSTSLDRANVSYAIKKDNQTVVASWSGDLNSNVPKWTGDLEPGSYTIETVVEDGVLVEQNLNLQPFASVQPHGHVVLTLLLVALAWGEQGVRVLLAKRSPSTKPLPAEKVPFASKGLQQEEDPMDWEDGDSPWRDPVR
jgi:cytoskeletal protein RodZ